jgi:hypothetical protein
MLEQLRLAIRHPNDSDSGSEEEKMTGLHPVWMTRG